MKQFPEIFLWKNLPMTFSTKLVLNFCCYAADL